MARCYRRFCRDGVVVHRRKVADRLVYRQQRGGFHLWRGRCADRDPALDLLLGADFSARSGIHQSLLRSSHRAAKGAEQKPSRSIGMDETLSEDWPSKLWIVRHGESAAMSRGMPRMRPFRACPKGSCRLEHSPPLPISKLAAG